ncbi:hypothetical protein ONZ43_g7705 [Nemania bipapillata]|uniref:Uncharacterized protein n=1 Tax=Nemania bipapillata TaxID=110536 RepID=A0ACC2HPQ2_9PEZI|nr:hypothetical protein ONZ43_g7705 [Nemania bipapillata]
MVENHHLERLSEIMKEARGHEAWGQGWEHVKNVRQSAFGGCQIIATGDFFQLPPVRPFQYCIECGSELHKELRQGETIYRCPSAHGKWPDSSKWAFQSEAWDNADFAHVELSQVYRQVGDPTFIEILSRIRSGTLTYDDVMVLANPRRETKDLTNAVRLYPTRSEVARYNDDRLSELSTPPYDFFTHDSFHWNEKVHPHLKTRGERRTDGTLVALGGHRYEPSLRLKVGMPVILLSNLSISEGLVNGSQGVVVDFTSDRSDLPSYSKRSDDAERAYISDILDDELSEYIASSAHPVMVFPVVQFDNGTTRTIYPECSAHEMGNETIYTEIIPDPDIHKPSLLCRTQIPLIAGWAMSIHKAQGMSLDKVIVDLSRAFRRVRCTSPCLERGASTDSRSRATPGAY